MLISRGKSRFIDKHTLVKLKRFQHTIFWTCVNLGIFLAYWHKQDYVSVDGVAVCLVAALWISALWNNSRAQQLPVPSQHTAPARDIDSYQEASGADATVPSFLKSLKVTLGLTLLLLIGFHQTYWGHHLELVGYSLVQGNLDRSVKNTLEVYVVDISDVPDVSDGYPTVAGTPPLRVIDRATLWQFIDMLTRDPEQSPAAIGVDVNFSQPAAVQSQPPQLPFSPDASQSLPAVRPFLAVNDPEFFEFCHQRRQQVRKAKPDFQILLGVHRPTLAAPASWLGSGRYSDLASDIDVPREGLEHLFTEMSAQGGKQLPSLGYGLADPKGNDGGPLPWLLQRYQEIRIADIDGKEILVNYSSLDTLRENTHSFIEYENVPGLRTSLKGKIVLLGKVNQPGALDTYLLTDEAQPVPGVFLHACLAVTMKSHPLYEIRPGLGTALEVMIAAGVLYYLAWREGRARRKGADAEGASLQSAQTAHPAPVAPHRPDVRHEAVSALELFGVVAVVLLVLSSLLVKFSIAWPDALLVAFALLIHTPCEHLWEKVSRIFEK